MTIYPITLRQRRASRTWTTRVRRDIAPDGVRVVRRPQRRTRGTVVTTFEPTGHVAVTVTLAGGEVTVEASELPGVEVELVPLRDNEPTRKAIAEARVEMVDAEGGTRSSCRSRRRATGS